jgi:hypothetical protein
MELLVEFDEIKPHKKNDFEPVKEGNHYCCPMCMKRAKAPKEPKEKQYDMRGRVPVSEERYEVQINQNGEEHVGKYCSLRMVVDDLTERGFKVSINILQGVLRGRQKSKTAKIKELIPTKPHRTNLNKGGRPTLTADKYEVCIKEDTREHSSRYPTMVKAVEELTKLGFKLNRANFMYALHRSYQNNWLTVKIIKG